MSWDLATNALLAFLAILNPVGKIPLWAQLTGDRANAVRKRVALLIVGTGTVLLLLFLVAGKPVLELFSVDLPSFRTAGGILLLITSISMVRGRISQLDDDVEEDHEDVAAAAHQRFRRVIVPMVVPMIAGPGSITTVMIYGVRAESVVEYGMLAATLTVVLGVLLLTLVLSPLLEKRVPDTAFTVVTRIFGLILAAIAVQFMAEGLSELFPAWTEPSSPVSEDSSPQQG